MDSPSSSETFSVAGLSLLALVARLYRLNPKDVQTVEWIQCDACSKWRKNATHKHSNGIYESWFCCNSGRRCDEICDHCQNPECECSPSQLYQGYSTNGYRLPDGFSAQIRFRRAADTEIGKPWMTYLSQCETCGKTSKHMDRRSDMIKWLEEHGKHNPRWGYLTIEDFDFKVDKRISECYATYQQLEKRGYLTSGIQNAISNQSLEISAIEREHLRTLFDAVQTSQFFDRMPLPRSPRKRFKKLSQKDDEFPVPKILKLEPIPDGIEKMPLDNTKNGDVSSSKRHGSQ